jgi:hypothetical protein
MRYFDVQHRFFELYSHQIFVDPFKEVDAMFILQEGIVHYYVLDMESIISEQEPLARQSNDVHAVLGTHPCLEQRLSR